MTTSFWIAFSIVFYTFIGYGIVLYALVLLKRVFKKVKSTNENSSYYPTISFIVAVFNEAYIIEEKIQNSLQLHYPKEKLQFIFITDGSSDESPNLIAQHPEIRLLHQPGRNGKLAAMERAITHATGDVMVFSDANTILNTEALQQICRHYADEKVGCVAGEKKVLSGKKDNAAGSESMYWKYESALKKWDSELHTVVGAAGELFSVRRKLYVPVPKTSLVDDFMISLRIAEKGYKIVYEPNAYAVEYSSANVQEEYKRKVRIAAGGMQSIIWLRKLLLPWPRPILWFQYVSHRVLRWTVTPFLMIAMLLINALIVLQAKEFTMYHPILLLQALFYIMAGAGWYFEHKAIKIKALFVPYYFCMMNTAVVAGIFRYFGGKQSVQWDKAKRKTAL